MLLLFSASSVVIMLLTALDTFALTRDSFRSEALGPKATETILELQRRGGDISYGCTGSVRRIKDPGRITGTMLEEDSSCIFAFILYPLVRFLLLQSLLRWQ